jgi:hypothetical protein
VRMSRCTARKSFVFTGVEGDPIETVKLFKYLGRILEDGDKDQPAVTSNIQKARQKWQMICRILSKEGANPKSMASDFPIGFIVWRRVVGDYYTYDGGIEKFPSTLCEVYYRSTHQGASRRELDLSRQCGNFEIGGIVDD